MAESTQKQNNKSIEEELEEYLKASGMQQHSPSGHSSQGNIEQNEEHNVVMKNDLLSQIAAEDEKEEKVKKKKRNTVSFSKMFSIFMMRTTLLIDEIQHKYAMPIKMLKLIWCIFIFVIYIGGIASLVILICVYLSYPKYVSEYFKDNNIELSSWDIGDYSLSRIELSNLKSKDGTYSIDRVVIRSGFSDFLRQRIKAVSLEGVTVKIREKGDNLEWGSLAKLLIKLNQPSVNQYKIGSISIPNAVLNVEGEAYQLPVSLSINGVYENSPTVSIPLSIKQDYMNVSALLSMSGSGKNLEWTLDNLSGNLSFPNRQPENIAGQFKIKTDGVSVSAIDGNLNLTYGKNKKRIRIDLRKTNDFFRGTLGLSLNNQEVRDKADETKTEMQLIFEGLDIKHLSRIYSDDPIRVNIQSFNGHDVGLSNASGVLRGDLTCLNFICEYEIKSNVPVSIQSNRFSYRGNVYTSTDRTVFTLLPTKRKNIILNSDSVQLDLRMRDISYSGNKNKNSGIQIESKTVDMNGKLSLLNRASELFVKITDADYSSNALQFEKTDIKTENILRDDFDFNFTSPLVSLKNNQLIKLPFALNLQRSNGVSLASLLMADRKINMQYIGKADFLGGVFAGRMVVLPFDLTSVPKDLNSISDIFPKSVEQVSGQLSVYGDINWKSEKQVTGPFYLMAKDVGFKVGNMTVKGLNTRMVVQSLVPFITPNRQEIFIAGLDSVLPFRNINAVLKFDNQLMHITQLNGQVAGLTLGLDNPGLMQYRRNSAIITLKNSDADFSAMNKYWKINGLTLSGRGSVSIPFELKDNNLKLNGGEVKLMNVNMKYTGKDVKIRNALFRNSNDYILRSGSVRLTQTAPNTLSAYLNFEGRILPDQIKSTFADTVLVNVNSLFKEMKTVPVPEQIRQRQDEMGSFFKK